MRLVHLLQRGENSHEVSFRLQGPDKLHGSALLRYYFVYCIEPNQGGAFQIVLAYGNGTDSEGKEGKEGRDLDFGRRVFFVEAAGDEVPDDELIRTVAKEGGHDLPDLTVCQRARDTRNQATHRATDSGRPSTAANSTILLAGVGGGGTVEAFLGSLQSVFGLHMHVLKLCEKLYDPCSNGRFRCALRPSSCVHRASLLVPLREV